MHTEENGRRGLQPETPQNTEIESMSKQEAITQVYVECGSDRDYRALVHICRGYPHRAELLESGFRSGWVRVLDSHWFTRLLSSVDGRVTQELVEAAPPGALHAEVV
jgi:hypothetical protein